MVELINWYQTTNYSICLHLWNKSLKCFTPSLRASTADGEGSRSTKTRSSPPQVEVQNKRISGRLGLARHSSITQNFKHYMNCVVSKRGHLALWEGVTYYGVSLKTTLVRFYGLGAITYLFPICWRQCDVKNFCPQFQESIAPIHTIAQLYQDFCQDFISLWYKVSQGATKVN